MVLHVSYKSLYISLTSSAKRQHEMTKSYVVWRTCPAMAKNFKVFSLTVLFGDIPVAVTVVVFVNSLLYAHGRGQ